MSLKNQILLLLAIPLAFLALYGGYELASFTGSAVLDYCYANGLEDKALAASIAAAVGVMQFTGVLVGGLVLKFAYDLMSLSSTPTISPTPTA